MEYDCRDCSLPELAPGNRLAWEIWKIVAQIGGVMNVDVIRLLEMHGIRQPFIILRQLAVIMAAARENAQRVKDGQ